MSNDKDLKFVILGGVEDLNRNCYVVEYGKDIAVVDLGLSFPETSLYGVDYLIPDVEYLFRRKERIAGIVLSHAHLDHVGAIPYVIEKLGFPTIYGRLFTIMFLEEKLKEFGLEKKVKTKIVDGNEEFRLGEMTGRLVPVTHSIPQSSSVLIKTPAGNVFYSGDFKFDDNPVNEPLSDYEAFKKIGQEGVSLGCFDSTNIYLEGKAKSETEIAGILEKVMKTADGRVIAATFSSLGTRLYSLVELAKKHHRKIFVTGRSMAAMISLLRKISYIQAPDDLFVSEKSLRGVPENQLLILATGTQGEEMAALSRMARGEHSLIKIKATDTVLLSSSVIPGNQIAVQHLIDDLFAQGARVVHQSFLDVHTSGHGYQEDIRKILELISPDFAMPVHGWPSFLHESAFLMNRWGRKKNRIIIPDTGQIYVLQKPGNIWIKGEKIDCRDVHIEGTKIGEIHSDLLGERGQLAEFGVLIVNLCIGRGGRLDSEVELESRGFVDRANMSQLALDISSAIKSNLRQILRFRGKTEEIDIPQTGNAVRNLVSKLIEKRYTKKPVVIPLVHKS